jgi:hypothetical protein
MDEIRIEAHMCGALSRRRLNDYMVVQSYDLQNDVV